MSTTLNMMGLHLVENAEVLAGQVVSSVLTEMSLNISDVERIQAVQMYNELFKHLGNSLLCENSQQEVPDLLLEWSRDNAVKQVSDYSGISEIVMRYTPSRSILTDVLTEISINLSLSLKENVYVLKKLNQFLDFSINETVRYYEQLMSQFRIHTEKEIANLSAPIVPIREGIGIIPLVGEFSESRIAHLRDNVVPKIVEMKITDLIADYSGIEHIPPEFGQALYEMAQVLQLLDVNVIATGLRPKLVKSIVEGGLDVRESKNFSTVKQALESLEK
ncbi:STAS domain-containing protein [Peribacillus sp. SCS-37]|uniref:STAS domain-containing protein n=1 Tax=Paraperibacillus esterisolvens TaxID=3115296 RepID=UPI003905AB6D